MEPKGSNQVLDAAAFETPAARWLPALSVLLEEQAVLCERLEVLAAGQSAHVEAGEAEALLAVLTQRDAVLGRLAEIDSLLAVFNARRDHAMARLGPADHAAVRVRIERAAGAVQRVRERDDADRRKLEQQRQAVADELAGLTKMRGAVAAYSGAAGAQGGYGRSSGDTGGGARFQDRHG